MKYLKDYRIVIILLVIIVVLVIARIFNRNYYDISVQETYERSLKTDELISYEEYKSSSEDFYLVDLRSDEDYQKSHLEGAVNIPFNRLMKEVDFKNKNRNWLLYSDDVSKTVKAKLILNQMGYLNLHYLDFSDESFNSEIDNIPDISSDEQFKYKFRPDTTIKPE